MTIWRIDPFVPHCVPRGVLQKFCGNVGPLKLWGLQMISLSLAPRTLWLYSVVLFYRRNRSIVCSYPILCVFL